MLALLAWVVLADQGAGECWWAFGTMQGGGRPGHADCYSLLQSHARDAALRALMLTRSVSVTSSALTTRAAVPTTLTSASPKVR